MIKKDDWFDPFGVEEQEDEGTIISNGKKIVLNELQRKGVDAGRKFLKSERNFFCLKGSAGTGKTTCAKAILEGSYSVVVTAPTHQAKKVASRATGYKAETIQKILGLKPNVELEGFSSTNMLFDESGKSLLNNYRIILLDEASMLSTTLVKLLMDKCSEHNIKLIFMGDPRQMPPIGEKISQVFVHKDIEQFQLQKVERQNFGNPLIDFYDNIIEHIDRTDFILLQFELHKKACEDGIFGDKSHILSKEKFNELGSELSAMSYPTISNLTSEGFGYEFYNSSASFGGKIMQNFKIGEDLNNRIIAWRNSTVQNYNNSVRNKLVGSHNKPLQCGEFLKAYNTLTYPNDWRHLLYENSADYLVTSVKDGYKQAASYENKIVANIEGYYVTIDDEETIFIVKSESYDAYIAIEQDYSKFADSAKNNKKWAWKLYYDFRNQFSVMSDIRKSYIGVVKNPARIVIDFDYAYAQTVHKSQGSTYDNVFIVADDFASNPNPAEKWRLEYVALSRPSKAAFILKEK